MDIQKSEPQQAEQQNFERINGQDIRVATLDEFAIAIFGRPLEKREDGSLKLASGGLVLAVAKFKTSWDKFYRLVWASRKATWLAAEDTTPYRTKRAAMEAGYKLAADTGAYFDES